MLAAIYNVWDDDLLQGSIDQIRPHVDQIIIVYQTVSNFGEEYSPDLDLIGVDKFIHYTPDLSRKPLYNETRKRNIGLEQSDCDYFICMDCDEYYVPSEFAELKERVISGGYDSSACRLWTYYKYPTDRIDPPEDYFVPFIHKKGPRSKMDSGAYPVFADPSRRVMHCKNFLRIDEHVMHHFSFVRRDIAKKFRNSTSRHAYKDLESKLKVWDEYETTGKLVNFDRGICKTQNLFNIHISQAKQP